MAETIILANGRAYKRSAFGDVRYYSKGWVIGFELNGIYFISLYNNKGTGDFTHFIKKEEYNQYKNLEAGEERTKKLGEHYLSESNLSPYIAVSGDTVNVQIRKRTTQDDGTHLLCAEVKSWLYSGETYNTTAFSPILAPPEGVEIIDSVLENCLHLTDEARQIYDMAKNRIGNLSNDLVWDMEVVEDVVELLTKFKPDVTQALQNLGMINLYDQEISLWDQEADLGYYYYTNQQLIKYRDYLKAFNKWYDDKRERFQNEDDISKLYWLVYLLDEKVLLSIPYQAKINVLDKFLTENIHERYITDLSGPLREPAVLKLLRTINGSEADGFLNALLVPKGTKPENEHLYQYKDIGYVTRFEELLWAIDDDRLKNFIGFLSLDNDNRKRYTSIITDLWKKSSFSFYNTNSVTGEEELDLTCYFNQDGLKYFIDNDSEYTYINSENDHLGSPALEIGEIGILEALPNNSVIQNITFNLDKKYTSGKDEHIDGKILTFIQENRYTPLIETPNGNIVEAPFGRRTFSNLKYHIFQPFQFTYYNADNQLMAYSDTMPAFNFFYAQNYQELRELDASWSFVIEVGIEVLLFLVTGGASSVRHIRHLRYITKLGRSIEGTGNAVKVWRGLEGVAEVSALTTSAISSTYGYFASTAIEGSPEQQKYQELRALFGLLALTSGITSFGARIKATDNAKSLINKMDNEGVVYNLDPELEAVIRAIGDTDIFISQMQVKINSLASNNGLTQLATEFTQLSTLKKYDFYKDFHQLNDLTSWKKINDNATTIFNDWKTIKNLDLPESRLVSVITNPNRISTYQQFFSEEILVPHLLNLTETERIRFIDDFGNLDPGYYNKMIENPDFITFWKNSDVEFKNLGKIDPNQSVLLFEDIKVLKQDVEYSFWYNDLLNNPSFRAFEDLLYLEEQAVLRYYTTDLGYKDFNAALFNGDVLSRFLEGQLRITIRALDKLPIYQTDDLLYRIENLTPEEIENLYTNNLGSTVIKQQPYSATYSEDAIGEAMKLRDHTVLIRIQSKSGKLIEPISTLKEEKEILHRPMTEFEVLRIDMGNNPQPSIKNNFAEEILTIFLKEL